MDPTIGVFTNAGTITLGSDAYWNGNGRFVGGTDGSAFTNKGLISLGSNAAFQTNTGSFSNAGTIRLGTGAVLAVETSMFTNNKSITLASEATLDVRTGIALSALGTIVNNGGLIEVDSLLNLGGSTLDVAASGEFSNLLLGGVADGTVMPDGGGTLALENGATLDAVTWVGSLAVATGSTLNLTGGVTVETAGGTTPGAIDVTNAAAKLVLLDIEPTTGDTIDLGGTDTLDYTTDMTLPGLANVSTAGGLIEIDGQLDLGGATITAGATGLYSNLLLGGIASGTVKVEGGQIAFENGALLSDVTYEGALLVSSGNTLNVQDGLRVETATGAVHGTITLASGAELNVLDSETLDNMTLLVSGGSGLDAEAVGGTLTFGKHFTLSVSGTGGIWPRTTSSRGLPGKTSSTTA